MNGEQIQININQSTQKYKKIYRLTLLSIPIITVYKKETCCKSYKICLLDKIPIAKIVRG